MVRARCAAHHRVVRIGCGNMSAKNSQTIDREIECHLRASIHLSVKRAA